MIGTLRSIAADELLQACTRCKGLGKICKPLWETLDSSSKIVCCACLTEGESCSLCEDVAAGESVLEDHGVGSSKKSLLECLGGAKSRKKTARSSKKTAVTGLAKRIGRRLGGRQ